MASLAIAIKADQALALQALLIGSYLEHACIHPAITVSFIRREYVSNTEQLQLTLDNEKSLAGATIIQYFVNVAIQDPAQPPESITQEWIKKCKDLIATDIASLQKSLHSLNLHLTLRSYISGNKLSVVDIAVWASVRGNPITYSIIKKATNNVSRWYTFIESTNPWISAKVSDFSGHELKERITASAAGANYDISLPNVDGPMVTRFPPEPSGYLHIGHAKAALLNDHFAHKQPGGTLICRFDDTNPSKESVEFQDAILEDLASIGITPDKISYSSDNFQEMYNYALALIQDGKAFADDSELGRGGDDRRNRIPSKRRDLSIGDTIRYFLEMQTGSTEGQRWCLRAKIAYDSPNGALRDPVIYRYNDTPHHLTGTRWNIYPTYDFCSPILDSIEGVTLALRTNEYRDRDAQYAWMQDALGLRKVPIWDFSRLNFVRTMLSKRKLTKIVSSGGVRGWDDPRMPTIRGLLRRGLAVPVLREFILKQGPSKNILNLQWGALWALNRKYIEQRVSRHTAILQEHSVRCQVLGIDRPDVSIKPKFVKNSSLGTKKVIYGQNINIEQIDAQSLREGEEITLMHWGNAFVGCFTRDDSNENVTSIGLELHLSGDVKKTKKISWLATTRENLIPINLVSFDHLIIKDKLDKEDKLEDFLTPVTEFISPAFADCNVADLRKEDIVQFERKGFYKLDTTFTGEEGSEMTFIEIPSGKA